MAEKNEQPAEGINRWKTSTEAKKAGRAEKCADARAAAGARRPRRRKLSRDARRQVAALVVAAVLVVASAVTAWLCAPSAGWGTDLAGGTSTTFALDGEADAATVAGMLQQRLTASGVAGARAEAVDGGVTVTVPAGADAAELVSETAKTDHLELVRLDSLTDAEALAKVSAGTTGVALEPGTYETLVDGSEVTSARAARTSQSSDTYGLVLGLSSDAAGRFSDATAELASVRGQIAVVVDGVVLAAPSVSQQIDGGTLTVSAGLSATEATALAAGLATGALPASLTEGASAAVAPAVDAPALQQGVLCFGGAVLVMLVICAVAFRLSALPILAGTVAAYAGTCAAVSALAAQHALELTHDALFACGIFAVLVVVWLGFVMSVVQRRVAAGKPARDALARLRDWMLAPLMGLAIVLAASLGFRFVLSSGDSIALMALAFVLSALVALLLVTLPLLRLAAAGPMARSPRAWGLPAAAASATPAAEKGAR